LLGWGSKSEIVQHCGVAEGIVAHMRRVKERANADTEEGEAFRQSLGVKIEESAWSLARLTYEGAERKQIGIEERAGRLARRIRSRLENTLSEDPEVTARALAIYDPELPTPLTEALLGTGDAVLRPAENLVRQQAWLTKGLQRVEAELQRHADAELSLKVGDGANRKGGISWGCLTPPLLH
jgi:hypothetical protein